MKKQFTFGFTGRITVEAKDMENALGILGPTLMGHSNTGQILQVLNPSLAGVKTISDDPAPAPSKNPADYLHIRAYGIRCGSYEYYIRGQQEIACRDRAPVDAVYKNSDGGWTRVTEYFDDMRNEIEASVAKIRANLKK